MSANQLGLNDSLPVQYVHFVTDLLTGELKSIRTQQPVVQEFMDRFPKTLELTILALIVATVLGFLLGIIAATHQNSWLDSLAMAVSLLGVSVPSFWLALILVFVFAISLDWLPATGTEGDARAHSPGHRARRRTDCADRPPRARKYGGSAARRLRSHRSREGSPRAYRPHRARVAQCAPAVDHAAWV